MKKSVPDNLNLSSGKFSVSKFPHHLLKCPASQSVCLSQVVFPGHNYRVASIEDLMCVKTYSHYTKVYCYEQDITF